MPVDPVPARRVDRRRPAGLVTSAHRAEHQRGAAIEHAGLPPDRLSGTPTGVFVGICSYDYAALSRFRASLYLEFFAWKLGWHPRRVADFLCRAVTGEFQRVSLRAIRSAMFIDRDGTMLEWRGEIDEKHARAIDTYWICTAEHGLNASTFTARIVASTGADADGFTVAGRIRAEGRADAEPVAANDSPANRALNRRVEVSLMINGRAADAPARGASR